MEVIQDDRVPFEKDACKTIRESFDFITMEATNKSPTLKRMQIQVGNKSRNLKTFLCLI